MQLPWEPSLSIVIIIVANKEDFMEDVMRHTGFVPLFCSTIPFPQCFPTTCISAGKWRVEAINHSLFGVIPLCLKQMTTLGPVKYICIFLLDVEEALCDKPRPIQMPELQVFNIKYIPSGLVFLASQVFLSQWF